MFRKVRITLQCWCVESEVVLYQRIKNQFVRSVNAVFKTNTAIWPWLDPTSSTKLVSAQLTAAFFLHYSNCQSNSVCSTKLKIDWCCSFDNCSQRDVIDPAEHLTCTRSSLRHSRSRLEQEPPVGASHESHKNFVMIPDPLRIPSWNFCLEHAVKDNWNRWLHRTCLCRA